jgi:hypothetical protein
MADAPPPVLVVVVVVVVFEPAALGPMLIRRIPPMKPRIPSPTPKLGLLFDCGEVGAGMGEDDFFGGVDACVWC